MIYEPAFTLIFVTIKPLKIRRTPFNMIVMKYEHVIKSLLRRIGIIGNNIIKNRKYI